ncbi:MAG: GNAT family N-acetyltransferase [Chloroflexi bacterium]|nr:GNAT family N-acetyltransferase [Chloroflexota bacterium]
MPNKPAPTIRPLSKSEIPLLDAHLDVDRLAGRHDDRFAQQRDGCLTYLIAWLDGIPIGHTMVRWTGTTDAYVADRISDFAHVAHVEDLFVMPHLRSYGIGTRILAEAERLAVSRDFTQIGLAVGIDNPRARALYERLGYADTGIGEFQIGGTFHDRHGIRREWREVCEYLIKPLP